MNIGCAVRQGMALARRSGWAVGVLFAANLSLAALAALPIYQGIESFTSHSLVGRELTRGFSEDWLVDFVFNNPGSFGHYATVILAVSLISMSLNSILAGGVLDRFRTPDQKCSLSDFLRGVGRYFWRMVWLLVIGLICYWIVFKLVHEKLGGWVEHQTDGWTDDRTVFATRLALSLLLLLSLGFVNLVMDYARVRLVLDEGTSVLHAFLASLGFSLGRFGKAAGVYLVPTACGLALLGVYRLVFPWALVNANAGGRADVRFALALAGMFLAQQIVMIGRYWFRVATWGSEWALYSRVRG
jgi:hypothetical protein